jgi:DNA-binding XRE family transcriptional regulator
MKPKSTRPAGKGLQRKKFQPPKDVKPEHQEFLSEIGLKLQQLRRTNGTSASGFSKQVGISRNAYHQMETGSVYFNLGSLMNILSHYKIDGKTFFKDL